MNYYENDRKTPHVLRHWNIYGSHSQGYQAELLYKRPRIDYRISEYIVEYINKNVLEPKKNRNTEIWSVRFINKFIFYSFE
jgi:hypothetical protein